MYNAIDIAEYIIHFCAINGKPISNLQLQKILYYVQINFYRVLGRRAFFNRIEAWPYGPVIPDVYEKYKKYGSVQICILSFGKESIFSNQELGVLNRVIDMCITISPWELVRKSHTIGGPWDVSYKGNREEIPDETIKAYAIRGR